MQILARAYACPPYKTLVCQPLHAECDISYSTQSIGEKRRKQSQPRAHCREELLEKVRTERATRNDTRRRAVAATSIQRHWRGHAARRARNAQLLSSFTAEFVPLVAVPQQQLDARLVLSKLVPQTLALLLPPCSPTASAVLEKGALVQFSVPVRHTVPHSSSTGTPVGSACAIAMSSSGLLRVARAALALLIRTCTSTRAASSYLALALDADPQVGTACHSTSQLSSTQPHSPQYIPSSYCTTHHITECSWSLHNAAWFGLLGGCDF